MTNKKRKTSQQYVLESTNIVILAKNFNPSIVSKEWLYNKKVIRESIMNFIHNPVVSVVDTNTFNFMLDGNRLQLTLKNINPISMRRLPKVAQDFIRNLPETPYTAIGFNYKYHFPKKLFHLVNWFSPNETKLKEVFSTSYDVGFIISFEYDGFIVRISAPPTSLETDEIILDINFHVESNGFEATYERLDQYQMSFDKIESVLMEILEG